MTDEGLLSQLVAWFRDPEHWTGTSGIPNRLAEHVQMSLAAVAIAALIALPLGMYIGHRRRFEFLVVSVANVGRAIPSFGLLFLFVLWFGLDLRYPTYARPAILLTLILLAIPPILTNSYVGIQQVDQDTLEAARGMGMTERGVLLGIEVPLGSALILAGLRIASVQVVATATLGAVIAGGGLGRFLVDGFATRRFDQILGGAILVAGLAIATELAFALLERWVTPRTAIQARDLPFEHAAQLGRPAGEGPPG